MQDRHAEKPQRWGASPELKPKRPRLYYLPYYVDKRSIECVQNIQPYRLSTLGTKGALTLTTLRSTVTSYHARFLRSACLMFQRLNVLEELYPKVDVPTSSLVGDH